MLASNFRFATEDVDIARSASEWPDWLTEPLSEIARENDWQEIGSTTPWRSI